MTTAFVLGVHEQRPNVASDDIPDRKTDNGTLVLSDPPAASVLDGGNIVLLGDEGRGESVLADRHANAMHAGDVRSRRLPDRGGHLNRPERLPCWRSPP